MGSYVCLSVLYNSTRHISHTYSNICQVKKRKERKKIQKQTSSMKKISLKWKGIITQRTNKEWEFMIKRDDLVVYMTCWLTKDPGLITSTHLVAPVPKGLVSLDLPGYQTRTGYLDIHSGNQRQESPET